MSILKKNLISNFLGSFWVAIVTLLSVPLYIKYLGVETYGLIGFYGVLQAIFVILDLGFSATINREVASLENQGRDNSMSINIIKTLEIIYWSISLLLALVIFAFADLIASSWFNSTLSHATVSNAIRFMSAIILFRWPVSFYMGGLLGLQRQFEYNILFGISETLKAIGGILILRYVKPDINYFFGWQIFIAFLTIIFLYGFFWKYLPKNEFSKRFEIRSLETVWKFSAGVSGIAIVSVLLSQLDKIIMLKVLKLESFSYYMIAYTLASSISRIASPIVQAYYPQYIQNATSAVGSRLPKLYHDSSQLMAVLIFPVAFAISIFSYDLLFFWTRNPQTAANAQIILSILVIGSALNTMIAIPYHVQLAFGWTKLTFYQNVISVIVLIPLLYFFTRWFGAIGAASIWLILNFGYITISQQFFHNRYLIHEKLKWYLRDLGLPAVVSGILLLLGKLMITNVDNSSLRLVLIGLIIIVSLILTILSTPFPNSVLFNFVRTKIKHAKQ